MYFILYEELLQPYLRDPKIVEGIYNFNKDVVYDSNAD